ncbi:TRAP transporter small permease [Conservatibacter flavescens]|uniref:TRAP transporter small permease protein n=1 Tax=Conservatibacter flavescens TaxID=28161 RepID=A0A2M8S1V9_9PAST|nr:TRAP transporter small permease [Conservatibacter flavescens]PJG85086.1 TRAP transporter small permease [Conservatibacter flavescens]
MSEVMLENTLPEKIQRYSIGIYLFRITQGMAILGGFIFIALIMMSCYSLIDRKLGSGGVIGDIEIMQMGCAVAASLFLPFCTIMSEHLKVDFFTAKLPLSIRNKLDALADFCLFAVSLLLVWRIGLQVQDLKEYEEVSALLSFPMWIPNALIIPSFIMMALCAFYHFILHLNTKD